MYIYIYTPVHNGLSHRINARLSVVFSKINETGSNVVIYWQAMI